MIFALAGNQNCGKTTLFNQLTGSNQHVGNFPGVTVDQKIGEIRSVKNCSVVDLPGIYSIRPGFSGKTFKCTASAFAISNAYLIKRLLELKENLPLRKKEPRY